MTGSPSHGTDITGELDPVTSDNDDTAELTEGSLLAKPVLGAEALSRDRSGPPFTPSSIGPHPSSGPRLGRLVEFLDRRQVTASLLFVPLVLALFVMAYLARAESNQPGSEQQAGEASPAVQAELTEASQPSPPSSLTDRNERASGPISTTEGRASFPESRPDAPADDAPAATTSTNANPTTSPSTTKPPSTTVPQPTEPPATTLTDPATSVSSTVPVSTTTTPPPTAVVDISGPTALADSLDLSDDKDESIEVLKNDSEGDAELDKESLEIITPPAHASSYRVHDLHIHYRSIKDFQGVDVIEYRICDTENRCDTAAITITVAP